jgi:hypothetical protein
MVSASDLKRAGASNVDPGIPRFSPATVAQLWRTGILWYIALCGFEVAHNDKRSAMSFCVLQPANLKLAATVSSPSFAANCRRFRLGNRGLSLDFHATVQLSRCAVGPQIVNSTEV